MTLRSMLAFFIFSFLLLLKKTNGQAFDLETASIKNTIKHYQQALGYNMLLYNGPNYIWTYPKSVGHPFFISDSLQKGSVIYDGVTYVDIPMLYEQVQQELIIEGAEKSRIIVDKEKVEGFMLKGHQFKWVAATTSAPAGFYECLYNKGLEVFAKHQKEPTRQFNPEDPYIFKESSFYYVRKDSVYHSITDQNDLLNLLADKKKNIKEYWKENKYSFKKNPEAFIINTVAFYTR